ncbi:MAG: prepilin-type N-terminal cleavage/methylation domain-containing protein [Candidatus Taylorbacteria bacterium]
MKSKMQKRFSRVTCYRLHVTYSRGFTLIEVLVTIAILLIIAVPIAYFQRDVLVNNRTSDESLQSIAAARVIVRTMVKELRGVAPGNDGSYAVQQAATSSIIFYSDTNDDGLKEKIRYYRSGTTLMKGTIKPTGSPLVYVQGNETTSVLMYNIRNAPSAPLFEYFDSTYDGTNPPLAQPVAVAQVRLLKISLSIDSNPNSLPPAELYTSQVMFRNLKDNL